MKVVVLPVSRLGYFMSNQHWSQPVVVWPVSRLGHFMSDQHWSQPDSIRMEWFFFCELVVPVEVSVYLVYHTFSLMSPYDTCYALYDHCITEEDFWSSEEVYFVIFSDINLPAFINYMAYTHKALVVWCAMVFVSTQYQQNIQHKVKCLLHRTGEENI
jgi:hypothetical protein